MIPVRALAVASETMLQELVSSLLAADCTCQQAASFHFGGKTNDEPMGPSAAQAQMKYLPSGSQLDADGKLKTATSGVVALEFKRWSTELGKSVTVIVFRGTGSTGDKHNLMEWHHNHVTNSGFTKRMREMWAEAGLEWTNSMEDRSKQITFFASAGTCIYHSMANAWGANSAASDPTEYWDITKKMIEDVYNNVDLGKPDVVSGIRYTEASLVYISTANPKTLNLYLYRRTPSAGLDGDGLGGWHDDWCEKCTYTNADHHRARTRWHASGLGLHVHEEEVQQRNPNCHFCSHGVLYVESVAVLGLFVASAVPVLRAKSLLHVHKLMQSDLVPDAIDDGVI